MRPIHFRALALAAGVSSAALILGAAAPSTAQTVEVVGEFPVRPADDADLVSGTWYDWFTREGGAAAVVDLTGAGGALETNQPLPIGAGFLSTEADNQDRANVGLYDALGSPADVFPTLEIDYEFFKAPSPVATHNLNAAAAIKMELYNPDCADGVDCFGTLVYEPYVNGFGSNPAVGVWHQANITPTSGGFWWSGGFGQPNSFAGPPYRTLSEWVTEFSLSSSDFAGATIVTLQVGVGSYNQGQRAYFDEVAVRHSAGAGMDVVYDFEPLVVLDIDVRPNNTQNQVNTTARQLVPVAILGREDFDPNAELDISSLYARGTLPVATKSDDDDVNGDGFADFTVYYRARQLEKPTEAECNDPDAKFVVSGATLSGSPFTGVDNVSWQGPDCNF